VEFIATGNLTAFDPQSPGARAIFNLWHLGFLVFGAIFVLVAGAIFYALVRYRWREGELDPKQIAGNKTVEIIWTAIPFLVVVMLFTATARTMSLSDPPPAPKPDLIVVGHQWWWEIRYPDSGVVTANEIHIPVGKPFSVRLDSVDVLHEFWVPQLGRKMTTVPGHLNNIWIEADAPGTYLGFCTEFCGLQHAWMHFHVVAEPQADFDDWMRAQRKPAAAPVGEAAVKGLAVFRQFTCVNCHAVNGIHADARVAPDLTHFGSRKFLGAGVRENTPENLRAWLKDPQEVKPGALMPNFNLTGEQIDQLTAYFEEQR